MGGRENEKTISFRELQIPVGLSCAQDFPTYAEVAQ